ncbi:MAG: AMP-binding protein [Gemmatimonadaceae bacterium]|nr:AMP-binding protein [Gemmatimonadaceae bacterium]
MLQPIDRFYDSVARNPDAVAIAGRLGADVTYAELGAHVHALAAAFQGIDRAPGGRVGICAGNTFEHLLALLATYAAGKVWVPLNPRNGRAELDAMIAATRPAIIVADASCVDRFTPTAAPLIIARSDSETFGGRRESEGHRAKPLTIGELVGEWAGQAPARVGRDAGDAQIIKFSGGSTGTPKPVVQSLRCVNAQADGLRDFFEFRRDDVNLIAAPLTHGASCFVLPILEVGGRHVLLADAKPKAVLDAISTHAVTTIYAPPTLLYALIGHAEVPRAALRSLRHVIYSAAPMPPQRIRDCQRVLGPVIETAYGQVEAPQIISAMRARELLIEENLTSVGRPSSVATVGIMGADGAMLPPGGVGEIVVSGPLLMNGYLDQPDETERTIVDGWLHTGDLGMIDGRGYLFIRGRLREVINSGGFKVFPADVEAALARHPAVAECAVFGMGDPKWGEAVNAAVVVRPAMAVAGDELIAWVKGELGSVKAPKRIWFVERLERNAAGKVSRAAVRAAVSAR